ncbi:MAG: aspartate kinase [Pseudomonadota bacterium]
MSDNWSLHKFGGSSLADAGCYERVAKYLMGLEGRRLGVVVSAMGGMTDSLLALVGLAERDDPLVVDELTAVGNRYAQTVERLTTGQRRVALLDAWGADADDIRAVLADVTQRKAASQRSRDIVSGLGELWSARLLSALLNTHEHPADWLDARKVLVVSPAELGPTVDWSKTQDNFDREVAGTHGTVVITGFIASDEEGLQTTLGRNGSDYSAAIFAALANARDVTIWTDVDGVLSADPNQVPDATVIHRMTYNEAMELAYFGAKVIHPQTLGPVIAKNIPLNIRNTFNADHPGTRIGGHESEVAGVKGITAITGMALVNLEGAGMIGVPGTADRMFRALKNASVSVTLISQASSEHSICIAVPELLASRAGDVIRDEFAEELDAGQIQRVDVTESQSIVAVVGDGMAGTPGVAARFFTTLADEGINIRAIAQGSSERNISAVIESSDVALALRAAHAGFELNVRTQND